MAATCILPAAPVTGLLAIAEQLHTRAAGRPLRVGIERLNEFLGLGRHDAIGIDAAVEIDPDKIKVFGEGVEPGGGGVDLAADTAVLETDALAVAGEHAPAAPPPDRRD